MTARSPWPRSGGAASHVAATATAAGTTGTPTATLTPTRCNSLVWAAGHDWSNATRPVAGPGQSLVNTFIDTRVNDSYWTQKLDTPTTDTQPITINVTGPLHDRWTLATVEIPGL